MFKTDLVIFDFDGVLIDSEVIGCQIWSDQLMARNIPVSLDNMLENYSGKTGTLICQEIEQDYNCKLPENFLEMLNEQVENMMESDLKAVPYVHETLAKTDVPMCVASGSRPKRLFQCLRVVGLEGWFSKDNTFSSHEVKNGKPAPDIFLYAASKMNKNSRNCIVVEDSIAGTQAGKAAGMPVFGFVGGSHCKPTHAGKLRDAGADLIFNDFRELPELIKNYQS